MNGAFLESPLYFRHSNFKFLDIVIFSNEGFHHTSTIKRCIITHLKHIIETPTPTKLKHLIFWDFDQNHPKNGWLVFWELLLEGKPMHVFISSPITLLTWHSQLITKLLQLMVVVIWLGIPKVETNACIGDWNWL